MELLELLEAQEGHFGVGSHRKRGQITARKLRVVGIHTPCRSFETEDQVAPRFARIHMRTPEPVHNPGSAESEVQRLAAELRSE